MEKAHAARAGLGWIGKNTLLLNEHFGSWLLLGEIITDLELEPDAPIAEHCGDCRLCVKVCPTGALLGPRRLDARRCIAYLTIEYSGEIPGELAAKMGDRVFGCDACQDVCPFNHGVEPTADPELQPQPQWSALDIAEVLTWDERRFKEHFRDCPVMRTDWRHMRRALANCRDNIMRGE